MTDELTEIVQKPMSAFATMEQALRNSPDLYAAYTHGRIESAREIAELRADLDRLTREKQEAERDSERLNWLEKMAHDTDVPAGEIEPIGDVTISGSWQEVTVEVGANYIRGNGITLRAAIDAARASSLPESAAHTTEPQ